MPRDKIELLDILRKNRLISNLTAPKLHDIRLLIINVHSVSMFGSGTNQPKETNVIKFKITDRST